MTTAPRYLGLDLGADCGYALSTQGIITKSGVFSLKKIQTTGQRLIKFYNFLQELGRVDEIYYEEVMFGGSKSKTNDNHALYHKLLGIVEMYAYSYAIPCLGIWPGTLKKDFCGHGGAEKEDMCAVARSMGWKGGSVGTRDGHDEVDAIALVYTQLRERYGTIIQFPA